MDFNEITMTMSHARQYNIELIDYMSVEQQLIALAELARQADPILVNRALEIGIDRAPLWKKGTP
jgi:hypothetical protein